jgi:ubiquinone/menaquinone biosynthesis C-methylase UbiE
MSSLFDSVYIVSDLTEECKSLSKDEFSSFILLIKHFRDLYVCDPDPFSFKFGLKQESDTNYFLVNHKGYTLGVKSRIPEIKFLKDPNCIDEDTYYYTNKGDGFISGYLLAIWLSKSWITSILPKEYQLIFTVKSPEELISDQFPSFEDFFELFYSKLVGIQVIQPNYPSIQQYPKENIIFDMINPSDILKTLNTLPEIYILVKTSIKDIELIQELYNIVSQMIKYTLQQGQKASSNAELFKVMFELRLKFAQIIEYTSLKNANQTGGLYQFNTLQKDNITKEQVINMIDKIVLHKGREISEDEYSNYTSEVNKILDSGENDLSVFKLLRDIYVKIPSDSDFNRGKQRVRELEHIGFFDRIIKSGNKVSNLLDFGGQNGIIGSEIGKALDISSITVTDISNWFGNTFTKVSGVEQVFLSTYTLSMFEDNSFDVIICFQVLHHIKNFQTTLKELYRICKPGGYFLIREHDCDSENTRVLIDLEHSLYECVIENRGYEYLKNYYANYFTQKQLNGLIEKAGFSRDTVSSKPSDGKDTRYYYQLYKK